MQLAFDEKLMGLGVINPHAQAEIILGPAMRLRLCTDPRVNPGDVAFLQIFAIMDGLAGQIADLQTIVGSLPLWKRPTDLPSLVPTALDAVAEALRRVHDMIDARAAAQAQANAAALMAMAPKGGPQ